VTDKAKILIVGSCGQIGNYLFIRGKQRNRFVTGTYFTTEISGKNRIFMDITDKKFFEYLEKFNPQIIIFPAFNPNVDFCETNKKETELVNIKPMPKVIEFCRKRKTKLVYYSTDYIFDGENGPYKEEAKANPLCVYGHQKLKVESMIKAELNNFIIARVTWVYGWELLGKNFVSRLVKSLNEGKEVQIPNDQFSNPTYAGNIATLTFDLLDIDYSGIINVSDCEIMSRYDFARAVAKFHKCNLDLLNPIETKSLNQSAKRPLKGGFVLDKIETLLEVKMKSLSESLKLMVSEEGII